MKDNTQIINQLMQESDDDVQAMKRALAAAKDSKRSKTGKVDDRLDKYKSQLAALEALKASKADEITDAMADGDDETADKAEKDAAELSRQAEELRAKIQLMAGASTKADPELVKAAIKAYRDASKRKSDTATSLHKISGSIRSEIERLQGEYEEVEKKARLVSGRYSGFESGGVDKDAADLILLYEDAFGKIDVTGHNCLKDSVAKFRFVCGSSRGLENTPAGRVMKQQKKEG